VLHCRHRPPLHLWPVCWPWLSSWLFLEIHDRPITVYIFFHSILVRRFCS
jgi:hypothetical protein